MTSQERHLSPPNLGGVASTGKGGARWSRSPLRHPPQRQAPTLGNISETQGARRGSNLSDSVENTRQSLKSSTDDLLLPRARSPDLAANTESSHWHSVPLALAFFPAIGGLLFQNGSIIVTDLTLLILAAIFLNWAVRLPWDWYLSAQSLRQEEPQIYPSDNYSDTIIEEGSEEDEQADAATRTPPEGNDSSHNTATSPPARSPAASELRVHELLALVTCFISPVIGAWLLHHIRSQLSRPSEGLVSNYNLTIFLLASEVRPVSHIIKMVQARTLHLQRTVAMNPHIQEPNSISSSAIQDLSNRLADLETHAIDKMSNGSAPRVNPTDTIQQCRKSIQPDLDALNRAVRRYEKRTTLLSLQTESRLQELEKRMSDAITLAAAAERQMSRQRRGSGAGLVVEWVTRMALLPAQIIWSVLLFPSRVIGGLFTQVEGYVGQRIRREMKTAGKSEIRTGSGTSGTEKRRAQGRGQKKMS